MATPSSQKKIQRVQQSGVTRRSGQRRQMAYPAAIAAIILVGLVLVYLARDARINANGDQPRKNEANWYEAYGTYVCDGYQDNLPAPTKKSDIAALGNGLIAVFPRSDETSGSNATLGKFFDSAGIKVTNTSFTLADGTKKSAGDSCGEGKSATKKTSVKLFVWPPQSSDATKPKVYTEDFASVQFDESLARYALALVPTSKKSIPMPPSAATLSTPTAGIPTTTAKGAATTTTTAAPSTTVASTTTVAPSTTKK